MTTATRGIHHVTAIATDPRRNLDFYAGLLGLRLVKKTVNFDDPGTYHLYYGDESGRPGTLLTFFPWPGARRGARGSAQVTATALSVPTGSLEAWSRRLARAGVPHDDPSTRFDERVLRFDDPDGMRLELVEDEAARDVAPWADGPLGEDLAIRGIHSTTLGLAAIEPTAELLTGLFGARAIGEQSARARFRFAGTGIGSRVDLLHRPDEGHGRIAAGSVHHVAFRAADDDEHAIWRDAVRATGLGVTPVQDRQYFHSIYFREPGGVLFEIATDPPGFTWDETVDGLGSALKLPPWLEADRGSIEGRLPDLEGTTEVTR